jgi:hypothetical protein
MIVEDIDRYSKDQIKARLQKLHKTSEKVYALLTQQFIDLVTASTWCHDV